VSVPGSIHSLVSEIDGLTLKNYVPQSGDVCLRGV
jgi:hypothetical protein